MTPSLKMALGALVVTITTGYLAYVGAARNWQYYLTVDETMADAASLAETRIRVNGHVAAGTLKINENRREAEFVLTGEHQELHVTCQCLMPDNLAEEIDVVVEGVLQPDGLHGHKVITKCASKYQTKEVVATAPDALKDLERR